MLPRKHPLSDSSRIALEQSLRGMVARYTADGKIPSIAQADADKHQYRLSIDPQLLKEEVAPPLFYLNGKDLVVTDNTLKEEMEHAVAALFSAPENAPIADALFDMCDASGAPAHLLSNLPTAPILRDLFVASIRTYFEHNLFADEYTHSTRHTQDALAKHAQLGMHIDSNGQGDPATLRMLAIAMEGDATNQLPTRFVHPQEVLEEMANIALKDMPQHLHSSKNHAKLTQKFAEFLQAPLWQGNGNNDENAPLVSILQPNPAAFRADGSLREGASRYYLPNADIACVGKEQALQAQPEWQALLNTHEESPEEMQQLLRGLSALWEKALTSLKQGEAYCLQPGELVLWNNRAVMHGPGEFTHGTSAHTHAPRTLINALTTMHAPASEHPVITPACKVIPDGALAGLQARKEALDTGGCGR